MKARIRAWREALARLPARLRPTRQALKQTLLLGGILLAVFALQEVLPLQAWLQNGAEAYRSWGIWGVLLFMATYVVWVILFAPGPLLGITAGALYGLQYGYLVAAASSVTTSMLCFVFARFLMRARTKAWVAKYSAFRAVERAGRARPWTTLLAVHFNPVLPFPIGNYMLSLAGIRFPLFVLGAWLGMMPGILFYVYVGVLGENIALDGLHLEGRDLWTFAAARVGLWLVGGWGIVRFGLLLRHYSREEEPAP